MSKTPRHHLVCLLPIPIPILLLILALAPGLLASAAVAQEVADMGDLQLVDRLVAVVDDDPIFLSDVERLLALGLASVPEGPRDERRRAALDRLIEDRLRLHEVERYEIGTVRDADVDAQVAALTSSVGGGNELRQLLESQAMDREALRSLLRRQLRILAFVEERLAPRVAVSEAAVRSYYDDTLRREMAERGASLPPLEDVREAIRGVLRERALNREIEAWTEALRERADIVDLLGRRSQALPAVELRIE